MSLKTKLMIAVGFASVVAGPLTAADSVDPAMGFVAQMMLGDATKARKVLAGPVNQAKDGAMVAGKDTLSASEFFEVIAGCPVLSFKNTAPISVTYQMPADLWVVWDCKAYGVSARVRNVSGKAQISGLQKQLFGAPIPPAGAL